MENIELNNYIEFSTDENILIIKKIVDYRIISYKLGYSIDERNNTIMEIYEIIVKKCLASQNSKFEHDKWGTILEIAKSYLIQKWVKDHEDLEKPE